MHSGCVSNPEKSRTGHPFNDNANKPPRSEPNSASKPGPLTPLNGIPDTHSRQAGQASVPLLILLLLFTAIGLSPGGSGYFTCIQNMKLVTTKFKSGGLREKHVVETWNVGNHLSVCL